MIVMPFTNSNCTGPIWAVCVRAAIGADSELAVSGMWSSEFVDVASAALVMVILASVVLGESGDVGLCSPGTLEFGFSWSLVVPSGMLAPWLG